MKSGNLLVGGVILLGSVLFGPTLSAHCDAVDGPVVTEARQAFAEGDVSPTLKWVGPQQEAEIRQAFAQAREVASAGEAGRALAERWFLETLIRLHREGEGAPYAGLKPAGQIDKAVALADKALVSGSVDALAEKIGNAVSQGIRKRFETASGLRAKSGESVEAGREFVEAYVDYVHYIEAIHRIVGGGAPHAH